MSRTYVAANIDRTTGIMSTRYAEDPRRSRKSSDPCEYCDIRVGVVERVCARKPGYPAAGERGAALT